ncbi:hypothetical protein Tco_1069900 [Tanacetum coccineum]|uniref:Copia protein n=1 Tax=Tanacetum coccineum TaxID=301880 RepID=A0ABQ5HJX9_9ASTR
MGCYLTSWFSKKQTALAISTTEAEYVSAEKACQQALWMKQALVDYDIKLDDIPILCDNKGAIDLMIKPRSLGDLVGVLVYFQREVFNGPNDLSGLSISSSGSSSSDEYDSSSSYDTSSPDDYEIVSSKGPNKKLLKCDPEFPDDDNSDEDFPELKFKKAKNYKDSSDEDIPNSSKSQAKPPKGKTWDLIQKKQFGVRKPTPVTVAEGRKGKRKVGSGSSSDL